MDASDVGAGRSVRCGVESVDFVVLGGQTGYGLGFELFETAERGVSPGDALLEFGVVGLEFGDLVFAAVGELSVGA